AGDEGSFLQHIVLRHDRVDGAQTKVELSGQTLAIGEDYIPNATPGTVNGQMVFAGNGWYIKSKQIDSYKDVDATGKIAVIFATPNANPRSVRFGDLGKQGEDWMNPADNARKHGAVGLIYVADFQYLANWDRNRLRTMERGATVVEKFMTTSGSPMPAIVISPKI